MAGRIEIDIFSTLDGVGQAPGGPEEDPSDGFTFGGWQAPLGDEETGKQIVAGIEALDALLLGRRTYDIFASYWPLNGGNVIGDKFNAVPKYVASRGAPDLPWNNSHLVGDDLATELAVLKERHENIHVVGSIDFARTLIAGGLFDQLNLWVYPIVLGQGKRLFPEGGLPANLRLLEPPLAPGNAVLLRYGPAGGVPATGTMGPPD